MYDVLEEARLQLQKADWGCQVQGGGRRLLANGGGSLAGCWKRSRAQLWLRHSGFCQPHRITGRFFIFNKFIYLFILFIYFWLCWVFIAARGLSLVVASGATLRCGARASHCGGFSCYRARALGAWASVVVARRLSSCGARA